MTEGSIVPHLASFAVPLMFGNLFQQLYNAVDTWVVGNYVSNEAFSAIGTISPIIMVVIGFFIGISSGISVVVSQYFGAKEYGKVHETVHTSFLLTFLLGIVLAFAGNSLCTTFLNLMQMPAQSFQFAEEYLRIYFFGILFQMLYNTGAGILRAVGDSKKALLFFGCIGCAECNLGSYIRPQTWIGRGRRCLRHGGFPICCGSSDHVCAEQKQRLYPPYLQCPEI